MALLSPKQQSKTKVSSATSQMTSSPRSPRAASSQAFSVKAFGDVAETNGKTRSAHVTLNSQAMRNNEAKGLGKPRASCKTASTAGFSKLTK